MREAESTTHKAQCAVVAKVCPEFVAARVYSGGESKQRLGGGK